MNTSKKNWAGYTYPAMLRNRIAMAEANWDMSHSLNRREVRRMKVRYWGWWKWAPIPAAVIGLTIGGTVGFSVLGLLFGQIK